MQFGLYLSVTAVSFSFDQNFGIFLLAVYAKRVEMTSVHGEKVAPAVRNIGCTGCASTEIKGERGRRTIWEEKISDKANVTWWSYVYVSDKKPVNLTLRLAENLCLSPFSPISQSFFLRLFFVRTVPVILVSIVAIDTFHFASSANFIEVTFIKFYRAPLIKDNDRVSYCKAIIVSPALISSLGQK